MSTSSDRFRNFAFSLLENKGALVERIEPDGLEALLPDKLKQTLAAPEFLRLGFASELPVGAERAGLESDWLDRFGLILGENGKRLKFAVNIELPPLGHAERIVEHRVALQNAVYRLSNREPAWTRYQIFLFRYTAISDEKREGVINLGFNLANGSAIDPFSDQLLAMAFDEQVTEAVAKPALAQLPEEWPVERWKKVIAQALPNRVLKHLGQFMQGMQRRLDRDLSRLHDYYNGLREEAFRKLRKQKGDAARDRLRIESAEREYRAKVADLKQKYDLRVNIELIQGLEFMSPVQRFTLVIKRRKGERKLALDWNPISRQLDPLPCEWSYVSDGPRVICDDALHIVSSGGHAPCGQCGKEYCRVCSPRRCPKCGNEAKQEE